MSQTQYEPIRRVISAAIPQDLEPDFQQRLESAVQHGFEYSLRTRLRTLVKKLKERTKQAVVREKTQSFIDLVVRVRNYLTHHVESDRPSIVDSTEGMYNLNQRLRALLIVLLLTYLGVPEDKVADGVASHLNLAL